MISVTLTVLILCSSLTSLLASTTFSVAPVQPSNKTHSLRNSITQADINRWTTKNKKLYLETFEINYPLVEDFNGENDRIANPFIGTVFKAYSDHYPLEFSVEDLWLVIAQGISIHLNENTEKYRQLFVSHEGKKTLKIALNDLLLPDSARPKQGDVTSLPLDRPKAVQRMAELIKEDLKRDLTSIITTPFSNTTAIEQAVFDFTLMDSVKNDYNYTGSFSCGIPQVTLRGSPDDFQQVINRLNQLRVIFTDFHRWLDAVIPHVEKMKASVEGNPDVDWWRKICHYENEGSSNRALSGWIADFIPYVISGSGSYRRVREDTTSDQKEFSSVIDLEDLTESVTQTDFIVTDHGQETMMKLIAGFVGIGQNTETGALRPCLGWVTAIQRDGKIDQELN